MTMNDSSSASGGRNQETICDRTTKYVSNSSDTVHVQTSSIGRICACVLEHGSRIYCNIVIDKPNILIVMLCPAISIIPDARRCLVRDIHVVDFVHAAVGHIDADGSEVDDAPGDF